jgi:hypothetical protein
MVLNSTRTFGGCLVVVNPLGGMSSVESKYCHCRHFSFLGGFNAKFTLVSIYIHTFAVHNTCTIHIMHYRGALTIF